MSDSSYKQILRSTSIIGGASILNIIIGLVRMKAAALLLGPAGVGLIGLFTNITGIASVVSGLGFGSVGTRQIATAIELNDVEATTTIRRAIFFGTFTLAVLGATIFWSLREIIAIRVMNDSSLANEIGWLALAVGLTVAAASQSAILNGMRRIGDLAKISIFSSLISSVLGVCALLAWGRNGLIVFLIVVPFASFILGSVYVARLPKISSSRTSISKIAHQWSILAKLGTAFMVASLAGIFGQLLVRTLVQRELGSEALGYFQAASTISMTYIGFVLTAMGTDYYPRLVAIMKDKTSVNRMINEQTEVALLLAGPVFVSIMALAPWVIELLYAKSFQQAAEVLRWQILGDVLKVCSWPLAIVILAAGDGRTVMLTEFFVTALFVLLSWFLIPFFGVVATGVAFFGMYLVHLPLMYWLVIRKTKFSWQHRVRNQFVFLCVLVVITFLISESSKLFGFLWGVSVALGLCAQGVLRLGHMVDPGSRLGKMANEIKKLIIRMGIRHE